MLKCDKLTDICHRSGHEATQAADVMLDTPAGARKDYTWLRPASDSDSFGSSRTLAEPVNRNRPGSRWRLTAILIDRSRD